MALSKAKLSEIPADAVVLTEKEALLHQSKMLNEWSRQSDVFAYKYGPPLLGLISGAVAAYINSHYRMKLKLRSYGFASSYMAVIGLPSILSFICHVEFVLPDVILQKNCVVCTELRSSALQAVTGCLVPAILSPIATFALATRYATTNIPFITKEPMKVLKFWMAKTAPVGNKFFGLFIAQAFAASVITYFEAQSVERCNNVLRMIEVERQKMLGAM